MKRLVQWAYPMCQAKVCFFSTPLLKSGIKDRIPTHQLSNVIYLFECRCRYVGKTTQCLEARIKQHVPAALTKTTRTPTSSITEHLLQKTVCLENFDHQMFTVVSHARSESVLHVLEALFIRKLKPDLCKQLEFVKCLYLFP